jgi:hypothetical protein
MASSVTVVNALGSKRQGYRPLTQDTFFDGQTQNMVESRGDIIPRPSQLDLGVLVSPHRAPDVLGLRLCSCGDNRGRALLN